jgi:probable rRNA maturation factor
MVSISVANQQELLELDYQRIKTVARQVLESEGVREAKVTIACMTDPAIQKLNRQFLQHDEPTDVISFPYSPPPLAPLTGGAAGKKGKGARKLEGDLAVSAETALRIAAQSGQPPLDELLLYIVHGVLHLCGYDDQEDKERERMYERQKKYLDELKIKAMM